MKNMGEKLRVKLLIYQGVYPHLVGGIPTPLKKKTDQLGLFFPTEWKIKHVPNHQPAHIG